MKFQTEIPLKPSLNQISYESQLLILGSCFAQNIGHKFNYFKFQSLQNPFGILFHPLAIENLISKAVKKETYSEADIFFLNERWHCFDAHSDLSDTSKERLLEKLNDALGHTNKQISKTTHIIITLGTAWVYRNLKSDSAVSNCHKVPQKEFSKELLSIEELKKSLKNTIENIRSVNKDAEIIFTVSPVRHLKDGFVENQRSKAHLIAAVHDSFNKFSDTEEIPPLGARGHYFPSYEIVMDELRDYRFFETDMVHPNQLAIDYVWEKFSEVKIAPKAYPIMQKVDAIQRGLQHRSFNPDSKEHQKFLKSIVRKITYLEQEYPFMNFSL